VQWFPYCSFPLRFQHHRFVSSREDLLLSPLMVSPMFVAGNSWKDLHLGSHLFQDIFYASYFIWTRTGNRRPEHRFAQGTHLRYLRDCRHLYFQGKRHHMLGAQFVSDPDSGPIRNYPRDSELCHYLYPSHICHRYNLHQYPVDPDCNPVDSCPSCLELHLWNIQFYLLATF